MNKNIIYYVYKHTFPNNKVYIGITCRTLEERWGKNGNGYLAKNKKGVAQPLMANAIIKYGWENVKHDILAVAYNKNEAEKLERYYITEVYHSSDENFGYNIQNGGSYNGKYTEKTIKKLKESHKNQKPSKEQIEAQKLRLRGVQWWNNGKKQFFQKDCPGKDFVKGRLIYKTNKNKKWWNKDGKNIVSEICPGEGWKPGKYISKKEKLTYKNRNHNKKVFKRIIKIKFKYKVKGIKKLKPKLTEKEKFIKRSLLFSGRKWWNNGIKQHFCVEKPSEDFIEGRLFNGQDNFHWWNNGKINKFCENCPGTEWKRGKLLSEKEKMRYQKVEVKE